MKLYPAQIPTISHDVIRRLTEGEDIEVERVDEAQLDIEAILKEYLRLDRELTDRAKEMLEKRKLSYDQFGRIKRGMAEERGLSTEEEVIGYLTNQMLESFMNSSHIAEVFTEEGALRRKVQKLLKKHLLIEGELDQEVRQRIRNLEEGTSSWEIEYQKTMEQIKRKHKLL